MAVSAVMGALSAGATAFSGGTLMGGFLLGSGAAGTLFTHFLISTAMGAALNALTPKPKIGGAGGYSINGANGSALDHQIIYGETRVGGVRVYDASTGGKNEFLHRILAFAGHEVDSYQQIYLNDEVVTIDGSGNVTSPSRYNGFVRIKTYSGTTTQTADEDLINETSDLTDGQWTSNHRLQGIAYSYVRFKYNADAFPNGIPSVSAVIRGKKVYDPRNSLTVWSDNPALCLRDYLTSEYGLNQPDGRIDDSLVIAAANICDQVVESEKRYTCNGAFTTNSEPSEIGTNLLTSMGGLLWYGQGKWRMKASAWTTPAVTFDEDDLRSGISLSTRHSRRDNFNSVKGTFRGAESDWQPADYPEVTDPAFLTADNGLVNVLDFSLPFTSSSLTAQRVARIALNRNREQLTFSASFGMRAFQVQVGDFIYINNTRFGWTNKAFEVTDWTFGLTDGLDIQVRMTLREISEGVFTGVDGSAFEGNNTTLPSAFYVPPVGISVEAQAQVSNQKVTNLAVIDVTSNDTVNVQRVEVEYKLSSLSTYKSVGTGPIGLFEAVDLDVNFYDFRARAINFLGVKGEWKYLLNVEVNAFIGDPSDVENFVFEVSGGTIFFTWDAIPDADLSHYEIKHNSNVTGATWSNSSTVIEKVARPGTAAALPARSGTFLIRAYDKENNFSENFTSVVVLPSDLSQLGVTETVTESPTFGGTKDNVVLVSSSIEINNTSAGSPTGEYFFDDIIDTGSSRNARVTGFRTFERRFDGATLLWDNIPQNFDTWPGLFDTWTDEDANFGDVDVVVYVSSTADDPSGTPTWGPYQLANGGFVTGRAFRFKAVLTSSNTTYTPGVTALGATVEY